MPFTSITSSSGRNFQLLVADPDVSPSVYSSIGGARTLSITINDNPVDITSVTSQGFTEWDADGGVFAMTLTISGIFDSRTAGAQSLEQASRQRVLIDAKLESGHGDGYWMTVVVNSFERSGSYDDVEQFTANLSSHGPLQYIPSS